MSSFHLYDIQRKSGLFVRKFGSNGAIDLQENNPDADDLAASIWDYEDIVFLKEYFYNFLKKV